MVACLASLVWLGEISGWQRCQSLIPNAVPYIPWYHPKSRTNFKPTFAHATGGSRGPRIPVLLFGPQRRWTTGWTASSWRRPSSTSTSCCGPVPAPFVGGDGGGVGRGSLMRRTRAFTANAHRKLEGLRAPPPFAFAWMTPPHQRPAPQRCVRHPPGRLPTWWSDLLDLIRYFLISPSANQPRACVDLKAALVTNHYQTAPASGWRWRPAVGSGHVFNTEAHPFPVTEATAAAHRRCTDPTLHAACDDRDAVRRPPTSPWPR